MERSRLAGPGSKAELRRRALEARDAISAEARARASLSIAERAGGLLSTLRPAVIAGYMPIRSEVDPRPVLEAARARNMIVALPATLDATTLVFRRHEADAALVASGFGTVAPPAEAPVVHPEALIVPLLAFDRSGARLGYGKGHYDRVVAALSERRRTPLLVGLAFAAQELPSIPHEDHDIRLDWVVTENETIAFHSVNGARA